jgi:outer membrane lipoprotein-sorting protein
MRKMIAVCLTGLVLVVFGFGCGESNETTNDAAKEKGAAAVKEVKDNAEDAAVDPEKGRDRLGN